ncbi:MAG: hypothetical protein JSU68_06745 [Phycisphaerales bacterium]|nr:MAG: hypothetical protein JSU68_06745 [Phycisphaerales bacterium]
MNRASLQSRLCTGATLPVAVLLLPIWGCASPAQPTARTAALLSVSDDDAFERLWDASTRVLRRNHLRPTREDRGAGVIQSQPAVTQSWFEFWRRDVVDGYSFAEAQLHSIRRAACIKMDRSEDPDQYIVSVRVDKERLSTPERQVTSAAGAIQMFGSGVPTTRGRMVAAAEARSWTPLGRDGNLEARLLAEIIREYGPSFYEYVEVIEPGDDGAAEPQSIID